MNNLLENFGINCFSEKNLKKRVPDHIFKKFLEIKEGKEELTIEIADIIANAIKIQFHYERANFYSNKVIPLADKLRTVVDKLEEKIASDKWPIPTYYDLLFKL